MAEIIMSSMANECHPHPGPFLLCVFKKSLFYAKKVEYCDMQKLNKCAHILYFYLYILMQPPKNPLASDLV